MKRILLNYASGGKFRESQIKNSQTGLMAGFNVVYQMSDKEIDSDFRAKNNRILSSKRGAGYWLWKPYFITRLLKDMTENDILFYADSGSVFIKDVQPLFDKITADKNGVGCFSMAGGHLENLWTKRDLITHLDAGKFAETPQRQASFMMFRGTEYAKQFAAEYLNLCCDYNLISDEPNVHGWEEAGFQGHRHDQSIWSLLTKVRGVDTIAEPSQWGQQHGESKPEDQFIFHTRDPK